MGRLKRERKERIIAGEEQPTGQGGGQQLSRLVNNPVGRRLLRRDVIKELGKGSIEEQVERLDALTTEGVVSVSKMGRALMNNAPKEMDKGIKKFKKQGREITVDSLCHEIKTTAGFLDTCNHAGISVDGHPNTALLWFENLARERMIANGITTEGA